MPVLERVRRWLSAFGYITDIGMRTDEVFRGLALFFACAIFGLGVYTFVFAQGASYLANDPKACMNCHVMNDHFSAWTKSTHHSVAVCNDCHAPHDIVGKYYTKALNGWNHSVAFTTGRFQDPIRINDRNRQVTENACRNCHSAVTHQIDMPWRDQPLSCVRCHETVGHLE